MGSGNKKKAGDKATRTAPDDPKASTTSATDMTSEAAVTATDTPNFTAATGEEEVSPAAKEVEKTAYSDDENNS